jgi:hypothetical protein
VSNDVKKLASESDKCLIPCPNPKRIQVFAQMYSIEDEPELLNSTLQKASQYIYIKHVTLTLRYTDWWNWEDDNPLQISPDILGQINLPPTTETFEMELETRSGKKQELYGLLSDCEAWTLGSELLEEDPNRTFVQNSFKMTTRIESTWIGSSQPCLDEGIYEEELDHHRPEENGTPDLPSEDMMYLIVKLVWTRIDTGENTAIS